MAKEKLRSCRSRGNRGGELWGFFAAALIAVLGGGLCIWEALAMRSLELPWGAALGIGAVPLILAVVFLRQGIEALRFENRKYEIRDDGLLVFTGHRGRLIPWRRVRQVAVCGFYGGGKRDQRVLVCVHTREAVNLRDGKRSYSFWLRRMKKLVVFDDSEALARELSGKIGRPVVDYTQAEQTG